MSEKAWNAARGRWEIDGIPITYRVTWTSIDPAGEQHSEEFTDVDQGYSFYEQMQRNPGAYAVTWDHVPW